jgi:hypothetical protein
MTDTFTTDHQHQPVTHDRDAERDLLARRRSCRGAGLSPARGAGSDRRAAQARWWGSFGLRSARRVMGTVLTVVAVLGAEPAIASATLSWSGAVAVDQAAGLSLNGVACPSGNQCTAVDGSGQEVTFDPSAPGTARSVIIDAGVWLSGVACPSSVQCTAVDGRGQEVTFNPSVDPAAPGGAPTRRTIDGDHYLVGVACPSSSQCTAVDASGQEVTFNPQAAPGSPLPAPIVIDSGQPAERGDVPVQSAMHRCRRCRWGGHVLSVGRASGARPAADRQRPIPDQRGVPIVAAVYRGR